METDEFFTIKEKDLLFSLYRKLLQLSGETLQKGDCKKLKTHLVNTIQNNRIQRDIFGLNPVIKDMQTATIDWLLTDSRSLNFPEETLFFALTT